MGHWGDVCREAEVRAFTAQDKARADAEIEVFFAEETKETKEAKEGRDGKETQEEVHRGIPPPHPIDGRWRFAHERCGYPGCNQYGNVFNSKRALKRHLEDMWGEEGRVWATPTGFKGPLNVRDDGRYEAHTVYDNHESSSRSLVEQHAQMFRQPSVFHVREEKQRAFTHARFQLRERDTFILSLPPAAVSSAMIVERKLCHCLLVTCGFEGAEPRELVDHLAAMGLRGFWFPGWHAGWWRETESKESKESKETKERATTATSTSSSFKTVASVEPSQPTSTTVQSKPEKKGEKGKKKKKKKRKKGKKKRTETQDMAQEEEEEEEEVIVDF